MFKLKKSNSKPSKPRERLDFKFSNFQVFQVPKGRDRLFVTLTSIETGKTVGKLSKAFVRNGSCQWMETLSESFWISRDDSSKEYEESLIKIVLSTGSSRSTILGEATVNLASYTSSRASAAVSLYLDKCSYGTILQVRIQCLTPRLKTRDEESESPVSLEKDLNPVFGSPSINSAIVPQSRDKASTSKPQETSLSTTSPNHVINSTEVSTEYKNLFRRDALKTVKCTDDKIQAEGRLEDSPISDKYSVDNESESKQASLSSKVYIKEDYLNKTTLNSLSVDNGCSSKGLLEAAADTIDELCAEAKMRERNSRKLMIDLDTSKKEFYDLSLKHADLVATRAENDGLNREVEHLKMELQRLTVKVANQDPTIQFERLILIQKELENDTKYQKDLNADLSQQLRQTQDSNIELIAVLQELEETIEQQRVEIENLSSLKLDFTYLEKSVLLSEDKVDDLQNQKKTDNEFCFQFEKDYMYEISGKEETVVGLEDKLCCLESNAEVIPEVESLKEKIQELEKDCAELADENLELLFKLKDLNKIDIRECATFGSRSSDNPTISPSDESAVSDDPEFLISDIEEKQVNEEPHNARFESSEQYVEIMKQLEVGFGLLMKPRSSMSSNTRKGDTIKDLSTEYVLSSLLLLNKLIEKRITACEEMNSRCEAEINERNVVIADVKMNLEDCILVIEEHEQLKAKAEQKYSDLAKELYKKRSEAELILADFLSKEVEAKFLLYKVSELQHRNSHLQQNLENALSEKNIASKRVDKLQDENQKSKDGYEIQLLDLKQKFEDVEKQRLEAREECEYLKTENQKLENSNSELNKKNQELHERCSGLASLVNQSKKSLVNCDKKVESFEKEVDHLKRQISYSHEERKRVSLEAAGEVSRLLIDKAELQASFQEIQSKAESTKNELDALWLKYETEVQGRKCDGKSLADYKRSEEKLKTEMNYLELMLTISEYERQQLTKEVGTLKVRLQKVSGEYEELNREKSSLSEKICVFQAAASEFEECKSKKLAIEEKIHLMGKELAVKEVLQAHNSELKNELNAIKRANIQFQQKLQRIEEEKDECLEKEVTYDGQVVSRIQYEHTKSSPEKELRDLRERYLELSLKYAEGEALREDLVMKLKATRGGVRRWLT